MNNDVGPSPFECFLRSIIQHYNHNKYWRIRNKVVHASKCHFLDFFRLLYIKRCDAFNNASMGTHIGFGAHFKSPPHLPHGLYGIIISHNAVIGNNCTIFHQVTIGEGRDGAPIIGDNCYIGAGAKIFGGIQIGKNVRIGANCVVNQDVPDNATIKTQDPILYIRRKNDLND